MRWLKPALALGSMTILTGLGLTTLSWARPAAAQPSDRAALRTALARLRAEVELRQLEHDAAREDLRELLGRLERAELVRETGAVTPVGVTLEYLKTITGDDNAVESLREATVNALASGINDKEIAKAAEEDAQRLAEALRLAIDRKKQDYLKRTTEWNTKRLELDDLERQFRESK